MPKLFEGFDFSLLGGPDFREDSVREELVVPLLATLGYSSSPPHRIIRGRRLEHPYVYIGTAKKGITIIPDYLLQRDGENAWILDAKAPDEVITSGKHVEQAYSYAIHKDVRVPIYALCNGHRLVAFDVSHGPPILDMELRGLEGAWMDVVALLGSRAAWPEDLPPGFLPDFGLAVRKAGLAQDEDGKKLWQLFVSVPVGMIGKAEDGLYTLTSKYAFEDGSAYVLTFDFGDNEYAKLLSALPDAAAQAVRDSLKRQPYKVHFAPEHIPLVTVAAEPGDKVHTNVNESYCPFMAQEFIKQPQDE
jgi:hypothetical protein